MNDFDTAYQGLNTAQRKAVDTIQGPVMVVAGPGTGKTQVLALRIAHILKQTDIGADGILCLTFTRSGVSAMRERLERYIGSEARKVTVATFHSFAGDLIEKHYQLLDFDTVPTLIDETQAVLLVDELLHTHEWEYIRPRTNPGQYFGDLKQLISILKRERLTPAMFLAEVDREIASLESDPESLSSRGRTKGQLKKEVEKKIASLARTKEVVEFYRLYELQKRESALMDYDDVLEYAVKLVELSEEVRSDVRESYQYVLVDEHQDSSGVQNAFLRAVWQGTEQPNIFVVGDDRQLIYGFSGASLSYFESFKNLFGPAALITLSENYRSTQQILALADDLLQSSVSSEKLQSTRGSGAAVGLSEYSYERDELLGVAQYFKARIAAGTPPESCALLVPKNRHVRSAVSLLRSQGIPVASAGALSLFSEPAAQTMLRILKIMIDPYNEVALAESMLDRSSGIPPLEVHAFLHTQKGKAFSVETLVHWGSTDGLFTGSSQIASWGNRLAQWITLLSGQHIGEVVAAVGNELLVKREQSHEELLSSVEIVRSFLHAVTLWQERTADAKLSSFLEYVERLRSYNHDIPLASFESAHGVHVLTLHKSKGLEYDHVWVAHLNEETLMAQKRMPFALPEAILENLEKKDRAVATRELYVAITRAKEACVLSYAHTGYDDRALTLSEIIADLPEIHFEKKTASETEAQLLEYGPDVYTTTLPHPDPATRQEVEQFVRDHYTDTKVSVTLLNNFFECPWRWYFRNFLKLPEVKGVSLALGSVVHSTIEFMLKSDKKPTTPELHEKIAHELKREGVIDPQESKRLHKDALTAVTRWIDTYYAHLAPDRMSERPLHAKDSAFPHLQLYGKIDLTERFPNGDIVVTDFKTGSVKTATTIEKETDEGRLSDYMRQLAMYSYLVRLAEKKDVTWSRLLFVEADSTDTHALYEAHISDEHIDLLVRDIREYDESLRTGKWMDHPCRHQGYGTHISCEYCELATVFNKK